MHRRYFPQRHALAFSVGNVFVDVDQLPEFNSKLTLFGYNSKRPLSICDRNHGPGDGTPISTHVRGLIDQLNLTEPVSHIYMFCYPAVFGKIFNPLTVYFGFDARENICAVVYEVNNTFGQRHSYAVAVDGNAPHSADKQLYVSPFNTVSGRYNFDVLFSESALRLNIALFEGAQLKLCARFQGERRPLTDAVLLRSLLTLAVQPAKVLLGIYWHAFKLYLKGLRHQPRPHHPKFQSSLSGFKL